MSIVGLRVVRQMATLESCETFLFSSDFSEPCHVPFHIVLFQFYLPVLARAHILVNVLTLYVAIFSRSPLVWWFFLTQRFLAPPVCSLGGPEPPPRSQTSMLLGTGGLGIFVLCMLVFHGLPFHADQCGLEGGTEIGVPSIGSCVPSTEEFYLPCYLTQLLASLCSIGWFGICVFLLLDQLPYQADELGLPGFWDRSFPSPRPTACQG